MARVRVQVDQKAIDAYFRTDPIAKAKLREAAEVYKEAAEQASPIGLSIAWGKFKGTHGYFKRHWAVRPFRNTYRVYNSDPFAHLVEYGSVHNKPYAPFRRALRAMTGAHVKESPKRVASVDT